MLIEKQAIRALLTILVLSSTGCGDEERALTEAKTLFNTRLRADKGPSLGLPTPRFYGDGGSARDEIISELYHSLIEGDDLRKLRRSECFWVQQDGYPVLSHEVLLADISAIVEGEDTKFEETSVRPIGTCDGFARKAESREILSYRGHPVPFFAWRRPEVVGFSVGVSTCTAGAAQPDPYNRCMRLDSCGPARDVRAVLVGGEPDLEIGLRATVNYRDPELSKVEFVEEGPLLPYCWIQAGLPSIFADTGYRLQVIEVPRAEDIEGKTPEIEALPHTVKPSLKVVSVSRDLSRPLRFVTEAQGEGYSSSHWRWTSIRRPRPYAGSKAHK